MYDIARGDMLLPGLLVGGIYKDIGIERKHVSALVHFISCEAVAAERKPFFKEFPQPLA